MKKLSIIITITILFVLLLSLYGRFSGDGLSSDKHAQATQHQVAPEPDINALDLKQSLTDIANNKSFNETPPGQVAANNANKAKMDYDSDWCMAATDLNEQGIAYYQQELEDWNLSRGRISPPSPDGYVPDRSQYLVPYMESTYDDLWKQIRVGNEYAMIAAMGRRDFDIESQRRIAQQLLVKGHTGAALSHLVLVELSNAEMAYKKTGLVNAEIEESIGKAMAYTAYGIKNFDLGAASTYITTVSSADYPPELNPLHVLGKDNRINDHLHELEEYVSKERADKNVVFAASDELPKAVKHDFESTLAYLSRVYTSELNTLKSALPDATGAMLENSECVQRQVEFINNAERKRKSRSGAR
jgi:hypothetical protein